MGQGSGIDFVIQVSIANASCISLLHLFGHSLPSIFDIFTMIIRTIHVLWLLD